MENASLIFSLFAYLAGTKHSATACWGTVGMLFFFRNKSQLMNLGALGKPALHVFVCHVRLESAMH